MVSIDEDFLHSGDITMKKLTAATFAVLASFVTSGVAVAAADDQDTDLIYGKVHTTTETESYAAERDFRSMPPTAAGRESMRADEEVIPKVLLGTVNDPMGSNQ
jgi:hypothetical protein